MHGMEDYDRDAIIALIECVKSICDTPDNSEFQFDVRVEDALRVTCWKKADDGYEETWIPAVFRECLEGTIHRVYPRDLSTNGWSNNVTVQFV